jgi:Flp pilus assembly protein TadG
MIRNRRRRNASQRRGGAAIELAIVAPLLFLVLMSLIEFSRATMVTHRLEDAANRGCRVAILDTATQEGVEEAVAAVLTSAGINDYTLTITPEAYVTARNWDPITVTVNVDFDDVSWVPLPTALQGITIEGSCTLPRETATEYTDSNWSGDIKK